MNMRSWGGGAMLAGVFVCPHAVDVHLLHTQTESCCCPGLQSDSNNPYVDAYVAYKVGPGSGYVSGERPASVQ